MAGNLVDERFELVSLVFRLAGNPEYGVADTEYQRELNSRFDGHKRHPVVEYARQNLGFGYDAVFNMAVHLEKAGGKFALIDNTGYLFHGGERWTRDNANTFVELLNGFYADAGFAEFFAEHSGLYAEYGAAFDRDVLGRFNFNWFEAHGLNPDNMRIVLSPSTGKNNYAAQVYGASPRDSVVYAALPCLKKYPEGYACLPAHEFAHSFANPAAQALYEENEEFRKWCDDSVNLGLLPWYPMGLSMAGEYLANAYESLYMAENLGANVEEELETHRRMGFTYIADVYALITKGAQGGGHSGHAPKL